MVKQLAFADTPFYLCTLFIRWLFHWKFQTHSPNKHTHQFVWLLIFMSKQKNIRHHKLNRFANIAEAVSPFPGSIIPTERSAKCFAKDFFSFVRSFGPFCLCTVCVWVVLNHNKLWSNKINVLPKRYGVL